MKKDGKKYRDDEALKKESILNVLTQKPLPVSDEKEEEDKLGYQSLENEDLKELLEKNKSRFFGGCGG
jgi:hypothetical protein